jgi:NADH dehydrogenase [ubiquinone] 1 alpha subcomplex assembly factor 5
LIANRLTLDPPTRIRASMSDFLVEPEIAALRGKLDAVVSGSGLHWIGDIVGELHTRSS